MDDTLKKDIELIVTKIFSEKEETAQKQATQDALRDSANIIEELKKSFETKEAEAAAKINSLTTEVTTKDAEIAELNKKLEVVTKESTELAASVELVKKELVVANEALDNIKKDRATEIRVAELVEAKVVTSDKVTEQASKVRNMTDEEFASYKQDRIQLREAIVKELATNSTDALTQSTTPASASVTTPPAQIAPGHAIASAMNFETVPSDDLVTKYAKLGEAMAANFKSEKNSK